MFKKEEGFTLVELMVVVLIIGILVAIAIPVFNAARDRAEERSCEANLRTIDGVVQQWMADDVTNDLATVDDPSDLTDQDGNPMLVNIPTCPSDGDAYTIAGGVAACANGHSYTD